MPIVHKPTFSIASVASPLLIEIVACGSLYLGEHATAAKMHAAAERVMFQVTQYESYSKDGKFEVWMLQTYLLMSCFGAYGGDVDVQEQSANVFPYAIKLTQDALKELDACPALTYRDWVYRETISRCVACAVEIGAGLASTHQCLTVPFLDASFPLPSHMATWQEDEVNWHGYTQQDDSRQALNTIFSGQKPTSSISELGLVSLVSMLLWRLCSFKLLTNSHHLDLYTDFVEKVERAIRIFDNMLQDQTTYDLPHPLLLSARFHLNTAVYHLYGSKILTEMKRLVEFPDEARLSGNAHSPKLHFALIRAAEALQSDCRLGISYLQRIAPHHYSPICTIACYEGGLLLTWYLMMKPSLSSGLESTEKLDQLIEASFAEVEGLREANYNRQSTLPLVIVADLLSNRSVWQWPSCISKKLRKII
ncbi:hypothetical protein B0J12DRAFT_757984 [Macrophomina phaseolina]|uniref:Xylanolytic transcriptional activator regulatory domain-containing protein n=1 Tax=Macrophomina phaseolina TaxID=35725 RepID=A0ABQ8G5P6_9PEZI|nr:hypothetical protein B0J12DRAFT_757984 [Macrophomina phaseolina]